MGREKKSRKPSDDQPKPLDQIPEKLGHITTEEGKEVDLHRGSIKHESLSSDLLQRIARLRDVLEDVYPMTLDCWVDGFMRDAHPEAEIRIMEACAAAYQRLVSQTSLNQEEKKRLYAVLCVVSTGNRSPEVASKLPAGKGLPNLESIAVMFSEAWQAEDRPK